MAVGKNIKWKKGKEEAISPLIHRGDGNFGEENQDLKNLSGEEH